MPAVFAVVDDDAIALVQAACARDLRRGSQKMAQQKAIVLLCDCKRVEMLARGDENMGRRLGVDVRKGVAVFILVDSRGWDCALNDFAKQAAHNGTSVPDDAGPERSRYTGPV